MTQKIKKMIKNILIVIGLILSSCSTKYQVVQELDVNMYHMHSPKEGVVIIFTPDKLKINEWYKMRDINILNPDNQYKK